MFLHGVSDGFVVELVGGFESKKIFFKKNIGEKNTGVWLQWSKNTFALGRVHGQSN